MLLEIDEVWIPDRLKDDKDGIRYYINHLSTYCHNFTPDEAGSIYTLRKLNDMDCLDACFLTSLPFDKWEGNA